MNCNGVQFRIQVFQRYVHTMHHANPIPIPYHILNMPHESIPAHPIDPPKATTMSASYSYSYLYILTNQSN